MRSHLTATKERGQDRAFGSAPRGGNPHIEKFKKKWREFRNGLLLAIAEEEMKIRREGLAKQVGAHN